MISLLHAPIFLMLIQYPLLGISVLVEYEALPLINLLLGFCKLKLSYFCFYSCIMTQIYGPGIKCAQKMLLLQALLYIAAEDEANMAFNREMDALSCLNERGDSFAPSDAPKWDGLETMPLANKSISEWLHELDAIVKEVEAELVSRDIGCHLVAVLEAVNVVLFQTRGFKRSTALVDSKCSYLHSVLSFGSGSGEASFYVS